MRPKYCVIPKKTCDFVSKKSKDCEYCDLNKRFTKYTVDNWESYILDNLTGKEYGCRIDPLLDLCNGLNDTICDLRDELFSVTCMLIYERSSNIEEDIQEAKKQIYGD